MSISGIVLSCNVGRPARLVAPDGRVIRSAIVKRPVEGRVRVSRLKLDGDAQADLRVHGGVNKAVYAYPWEHYASWKEELGIEGALSPGSLGENLTTEGLDETTVAIGDRLRVGSAVLVVAQPRMPCFKLAAKFSRPDLIELFWRSGRSGWYLRVEEEGELGAGDQLELLGRAEPAISVADVVRLYRDGGSGEELERAIAAPLSGSWGKKLRAHLP